MTVNRILLTLLIVFVIVGLSMEANAGQQGGSKTDYNITCAALAVASEQEDKAIYYANLIPEDTSMAEFEAIVRSVSRNIYKYAEVQGVTTSVVAGYAFNNYGCDRPFI